MDLKKMFGDKYLVTLDESWEAETPANRAEFRAKGQEIWYYEIKGRRGTAYFYSDTMIAVTLPNQAARRLMKLLGPELILMQRADDAMSFKADAKHASTIVRFIKPKRLRQLSAEQKLVLAARLAANRYQSGQSLTKNTALLSGQLAVLPGADSRPLGKPHVEILDRRPI